MARGTDAGAIVFAYDGSHQAKAAIAEAAHLLGAGRRAIVLTVWEPLAAQPFVATARVVPPDVEDGVEREAASVAYHGAKLARSVGFDAQPLTRDGQPVWRSIVEAADEHDASLLVLGSHGRTGIGLVLMGSVAAAVARHTELPVLIVHAPPPVAEAA
jgi:nucleotide-binding universal stress UspA family protein